MYLAVDRRIRGKIGVLCLLGQGGGVFVKKVKKDVTWGRDSNVVGQIRPSLRQYCAADAVRPNGAETDLQRTDKDPRRGGNW